MTSYDYVVVGGGTAGCVLAGRLSEDPTSRVLLLEAGRGAGGLKVRAPAAFSALFKTDRDWDFSTTPQSGMVDRSLYWPRGRMLGGCSSLNAMMVVRGNRLDYDGWRDAGCPGWGFDEVLPYFKRSEDWTRGPSAERGGGGPFTVTDLARPAPVTGDFLAAAEAVGLARNDDVNGPDQDGVGYTQVNQRGGERWSVVNAYLEPARRRPNLDVRTRSTVTRVVVSQGRATAVEYLMDGAAKRVRVGREVVLAAGAVGSPHLLQVSGVGSGSLLQALGIPVVVDAPGVGQDLQDHLACGVVVQSQGVATLARADSIWNVLRYVLTRGGPLTSNVAEACGFYRTRPDLRAPDLEVIFAPAGFADHGFQRFPGDPLTVGGVLLQPRSRGSVSAAGPDAMTAPTIEPNYLSDPGGRDLTVLVEGVKLARRILAQEPLARHVTGAIAPVDEDTSDEALGDFVRSRAETLYHPVGTCRMGSDATSVVTPELTVRGVEGLRVADASIMPRIIRGHPHWPVIMIAEKASDLILADR